MQKTAIYNIIMGSKFYLWRREGKGRGGEGRVGQITKVKVLITNLFMDLLSISAEIPRQRGTLS